MAEPRTSAAVPDPSADPNFPLDEGQLTPLAALLAAYILGVAVEQRPAGRA